MLPALSTARLSLRAVTRADLPLLVGLNADSEVMGFILGRAATPAETESEWERRLSTQSCAERGLGYWLGCENGAFAGWWSASSYAELTDLAGIGYRLPRSAWGRGLATEGARAMVLQAFRDPFVERVVASTLAANAGSRRVLEKAGLRHASTYPSARWGAGAAPAEEVGYELTRAEWERRGPGAGPRA